ncbi:MAG: hypothetical protein WA234_08890 [Rectinemataceae bacterium]
MAESFFELSATANNGKSIDFGIYKGLEELYRAYKDRGFVILAFPCDQFAHQEPGSDADIAAFCQINYGVSFPLMAKIEVNGKGLHDNLDPFLEGAFQYVRVSSFLVIDRRSSRASQAGRAPISLRARAVK